MMRWIVTSLTCALCAAHLASAPLARAQEPVEDEVAESEDAAQTDEDDDEEPVDPSDCEDERSLSWLARRGLLRHLADVYPWITEPVVEESLVTCADEEETLVVLSFEPHLTGPGWDRSWLVGCTREGWWSWTCEPPEDTTSVYLTPDDAAVPIADDVSTRDALAALAAVVIQSTGPGIPDPFDASEPFRDLTPEAVLSVTREEFCGGVEVTIQIDPTEPKLQLCVEREACDAKKQPCELRARVQGTTE